MEYNDEMVREAIERECARNGQSAMCTIRVEDIAGSNSAYSETCPRS